LRLRLGVHWAVVQRRQRRHHHLGAQRRELIVQGSGVVIPFYGNAVLRKHRAGIEAGVHSHDRYAGLAIAFEKRALDGRRAAPARQQ
jgi:hypothetical protein